MPRIEAIQQFACLQISQTGNDESDNINTCIRARPSCSDVGPLMTWAKVHMEGGSCRGDVVRMERTSGMAGSRAGS